MKIFKSLIVAYLLFTSIDSFCQESETFLNNGINKFGKSDFAGALTDYSKFIEICKTTNDGINESKGHYMRGLTYMQLKNYTAASDDLLQGYPYNHGDDFYVNVAECYYRLNDFSALTEIVQKGISKTQDPQTKAKLYKFSGLSLYDNGAKTEACEFFKLSMDLGNTESKKHFTEYCQTDKKSKYYDEIAYNTMLSNSTKQYPELTQMEDGSRFKGSIINYKMEGKGTLEMQDGTIYEGDFHLGIFDGNGILKFANGESYTGQFVNGIKTGTGEYIFKNGSSYKGNWLNDQYNGQGIFKDINSGTYTGKFQKNEPQGQFSIKFNDGGSYDGVFKGWKKNGYGTATFTNGDIYIGDFVNDAFQGQGKYVAEAGWFYEGAFIEGVFAQQGKMVMADGKTWYSGSFENGKYDGSGEFHFADGQYYKGMFKNGQKNGIGTLYNSNGNAEKTGNWVDDNFVK